MSDSKSSNQKLGPCKGDDSHHWKVWCERCGEPYPGTYAGDPSIPTVRRPPDSKIEVPADWSILTREELIESCKELSRRLDHETTPVRPYRHKDCICEHEWDLTVAGPHHHRDCPLRARQETSGELDDGKCWIKGCQKPRGHQGYCDG